MRLTSIELENFRCFEKEKIDLHPQLNVFVGLNASGKTALLEGVACGISRYLFILFGYKYLIEEKDIRRLGRGTDNFLNLSIDCIGIQEQSKSKFEWSRVLGNTHNNSESKEFDKYVRSVKDKIYDQVAVELPVISYYSTRRIWGGETPKNFFQDPHVRDSKRFLGYVNCLEQETNTFVFENELDREQKAAQQSKELRYEFDGSRLEMIRSLAGKVISDCEIFYFDYEMESLAVMFKDGRRIAIDDLSDGQKSLLLISTGIAFQCATLNPHMGLDAYKSSGVVLIDEVELHLHPDWQRQILPILTREFPNIQFICTTHSPQVISMLKPENVQVIKDFKVTPISGHTKGRDSNSILNDVFGLSDRPQEYMLKLNRFYDSLDRQDEATASQIFEELQKDWGMHDLEIVKAEWRLMDLKSELDSHAVH